MVLSMSKFIIRIMLVLFLLSGGVLAAQTEETNGPPQQQGHMKPPVMPCDRRSMKEISEFRHPHWLHLQSLKLSEKQKEALKEIEDSTAKELIRKNADERIAEIELRELLDQETFDLKAVEAKLKQIATIKTESHLAAIKSMENMKAKLTSEQREKLKTLQLENFHVRPPHRLEMTGDEAKTPPPYTSEKGE
jgi:Spy/CpxP family protein refolding chaperone